MSESARFNMVEAQIRTANVTDPRIHAVMSAVAREKFVPRAAQALAYADVPVAIAPGRFLLDPRSFAKLLQLAQVTADDRVLDVGCGTGYVSAVLSLIAGKVVALESDEDLAAQAKTNLAAHGYDNVTVVTGDLEKGNVGNAPFDVIFIDGSVEQVPQALLDQLGEGGRLIVVLGFGHAARATVFMRERGALSENVFFNASIKPLPGFAKAKEFVF